jgi:hypothetical protein
LTSIIDSLQSSVVTRLNFPYPIQPYSEQSLVVSLQFNPRSNGVANATLAITTDDTNDPLISVALSATGVPIPQLALAVPATLIHFGGQVDDGPGGYQTTEDILIQNHGTGPLAVSKNGISLLTGTQFKIVSVTSSIQGTLNLSSGPATLAAGGVETWDIQVTFDPLVLGLLNDGLQILSNDPNNPVFTLSLQGQGQSPARLRRETTLPIKAIASRVHLGSSRSAYVRWHEWIKSFASTAQASQARLATGE